MIEINNIDLEEVIDNEPSCLINDLSEEDIQDASYLQEIVNDEDMYSHFNDGVIFSPQIEVFEPFAAHVDASRTNMSAKQLLQTVTGVNNNTPFILNKNYVSLTEVNSPFVEYAEEDGLILFSDYNYLIIYYSTSKKIRTIYVPPVMKLTNNALKLRYKMNSHKKQSFKKGDMLFDYTGQTEQHVPKIGYRTKILYGSFYGYTADDAFVMSESYAKRATIDYTKKIFIPITKELKYLKNQDDKYFHIIGDTTSENYMEYFKIDNSDSFLSEFNNTSNKPSKIFGKQIDSINGGEVVSFKVHKLTDQTFDELNQEYIYCDGIIQEIHTEFNRQMNIKNEIYRHLKVLFKDDISQKLSHQFFSQWESAEKFPDLLLETICNDYKVEKDLVDFVIEIEIYKSEPTCIGDKFANVYAGKGVCSLILPDELMPSGADIIFNPLGLFGRNNWGTIFEIGIAKMILDIEAHIEDKSAVINRIEFIRQNFIELFDKEYSEKILELLYNLEQPETWEEFKKSVLENGLYFFVDNFPQIPFIKFIREFVVPYEEKFNINIRKKEEIIYSKELMQYMRDRGYTSSVFSKEHVEDVPQKVFIGYNYWIKLYHTAFSKYNSIAFANTYSKSTGEPPRGRNNNGGHHISWQSTAALEGHLPNNPASVEIKTIKSDAVKDKNNFNRKMIKDGKYTLKDKYSSQTVKTLNNALKIIGLKFIGIYDDNHEDSFEDKKVEVQVNDLFCDDVNHEAEQFLNENEKEDISKIVEDSIIEEESIEFEESNDEYDLPDNYFDNDLELDDDELKTGTGETFERVENTDLVVDDDDKIVKYTKSVEPMDLEPQIMIEKEKND